MRLELRAGHEIGRQKTSRSPHRRCRSTYDPHSRGSWRHARTRIWYPATLAGSIWSVQIPQCSSSRLHRRFFSPFSIRDLRRRRRSLFFYGALLVCTRARRPASLPRNYFRMIPIAGQIKTALSAAHADCGSFRGGNSFPKDPDRRSGCERDSSREQNRIPPERTCDYAPPPAGTRGRFFARRGRSLYEVI